ncbi:MAG TPA: hypothetical protein VLT33_49850 [Labilithrix sp.]|nr:hypothetical protein [Labilithrix sp.]
MHRRTGALGILLLGSLLTSRLARAQPQSAPADEIAALRASLEAQQRRVDELEARVTRTEAPRESKTSPALTLSGYVHVDWVPYRQSSQDEVSPTSGEPLNENRFVIRRARLRLESDQGLLHGALMLDANTIRGLQVRPWNLEASLKWPPDTPYRQPSAIAQSSSKEAFVIVSAGLLVTPFGFDVPELEIDRPFLERTTMASELVPQSYDLGLRVLGGYKFVNYAFAIVNGDPIGESTFPGRDPSQSKDLVFRLGTSTEVVPGLRFDAGFSGLNGRGFHKGNAPTKDQLVWRDQNEDGQVQQTELQVITGSPATPSQGFQRFALGADARVHLRLPRLGELTVRAEIVRAKNLDRGTFAADPVATSRDLRELGWTLAVTQELTRWGLVGVRYDTFDPDADAREQRPFALVPKDSSLSTWTFMGQLRWKTARLIAEYDHRTNALGRDVSGAPTTLADDSFTLRAAVGF